MSKVNIEKFTGGLSLLEPSVIKDSQFEVLKNMFYNGDKRIQSRRGIKVFGNAIGVDPITSYYFFQNDTTLARIAVATAGTNMYKYNEGTSNWDSIKSGLTAFEADGTTRTRWSFAVYLNKIYMCNGIDDYAEYDGTTYTELGTQPKCRYLRYMADGIYGAGEDLNPSTVYGTAAGAPDGTVLDAANIKVGGDELGRINGIIDLGNIPLIIKNSKTYSIAGDLSTSDAIDTQNGGYCHRALKNVENALFYYNDTGIDRLRTRNGVVGAAGLASKSISSDVKPLLDEIAPKQYNSGAGYYIPAITNYYYTFDTGNDSIPETTLVYSSLVSAWSEYNLPALYDYGYYIDEDGVYHYLAASATGGQMNEIETGFQDFGKGIETELKTKRWDFGDISTWKTYDSVDVIGLKNLGSDITIEILVDGEIATSAIINDNFITATSGTLALSQVPIGIEVIGGGSGLGDGIDLFSYLIRIPMYASGPNIQVRMYSNTNPNIWTLDKIRINYGVESMDIFDYSNIA